LSSYELWINGSLFLGNLPTNRCSATLDSVLADGTYTWKIRAVLDGGGEIWSNETWSFQIKTILPAPSSLTAQVFNLPWRVQLNWIDNSDNELGFVISRDDTVSVGFEDIDTVSTNVTTYTDTDVDAVFMYVYKIYAFNADTVSDFSDTAQVIVPVELQSFTSTLSGNSVIIQWSTATELNNRGFEIERMIDKVWEKIAFIEGEGTTSDERNYQYVDDFKFISVKGTIQYRLKQINFNGTYEYSNVIEVYVDFTPKEFLLYQNFPNPFNPSTSINFSLPVNVRVRINIYNSLGELVSEVINKELEAGYHKILFGGASIPSGIYFYRLQAGNFIETKKMILMK